MMVPVTTGGNSGSSWLMKGAATMPKIQAAMTEPQLTERPDVGCRSHRRHRAHRGEGNAHHAWQAHATSSGDSFSARPMIRGTATAPGIYHEHMLQPKCEQAGGWQDLVDGIGLGAHGGAIPIGLCRAIQVPCQ